MENTEFVQENEKTIDKENWICYSKCVGRQKTAQFFVES